MTNNGQLSTAIITVTYRSSEKIIPYLNSLSSEIGKQLSIYCIENNSPDAEITLRNINAWKKMHKEKSKYVFYIFNKTNDGFGRACNFGFELTNMRFKYILLLNPDLTVEKNAISKIIKHAYDSNADISGGKMISSDGKTIQKSVFKIPNIFTILFEFSNLKKIFNTKIGEKSFYIHSQNSIQADTPIDGVSGGFMLIKSTSYRKISGFNIKYFMYLEDVDFCARAKKLGFLITYCPHSVVYHEGGASSNNKDRIRHVAWFNSRRTYLFLNFNLLLFSLILPIYMVEELILFLLGKYPINIHAHN